MLMPLLAHFFIRETRVESIATSWLISVGTLIFCAVRMNSQLLVHPIIIYICGSLAIYYDTKRQNDDMLRLVAALQATAKEVERLQEETRAFELRAMIGNVAHDLKTVSIFLWDSLFSPFANFHLYPTATNVHSERDRVHRGHHVPRREGIFCVSFWFSCA
jgi:hypothetical protein